MKRLVASTVIVLTLLSGVCYFVGTIFERESKPLFSPCCGALWRFEHQVVDPDPLARARINDLQR